MDGVQPGAHGATITTPRLFLRALRLDDVHDLHIILSHPEVRKYSPRPHEVDVSSSTEFIQKQLTSKNSWNFVVELRDGGFARANDQSMPEVIGICGGHDLPEVGYLWNESFWGHGYATEALQAFVQAYWETYPEGFRGLEGDQKDFLSAWSHERNKASHSVLRKSGFELVKEETVDHPKLGKHTRFSWKLWRPSMEERIERKTFNAVSGDL